MNRISIVILSITMLLALATGTQGAIHSGSSDFTTYGFTLSEIASMQLGADTWYDITPNAPNLKASYFRIEDTVAMFYGEYYLNDQTFVALAWVAPDDSGGSVDSELGLSGSYLFNFGLFIGFEYFTLDVIASPPGPPFDAAYNLSIGYSYSLGENSYVAFSVDYTSVPDVDFAEIVGYDLDLVYYFDTGRVYFQYYLPTDEGFLDDNGLDLGAAFQVAETVVLGFNYNAADDEYDYDLGLTWKPEFMIFDFQIGGDDMENNYYNLGFLFHLNENYHLGLEWRQYEDVDAQITLKFKYTNDTSQFLLAYALENDYDPAMYYLRYKISF
jgi:hypothetical protein